MIQGGLKRVDTRELTAIMQEEGKQESKDRKARGRDAPTHKRLLMSAS